MSEAQKQCMELLKVCQRCESELNAYVRALADKYELNEGMGDVAKAVAMMTNLVQLPDLTGKDDVEVVQHVIVAALGVNSILCGFNALLDHTLSKTAEQQ